MPFAPLSRVRTRALVSVVATPALLLALAACGGGDSTAPPVPEAFTKTAGDGVAAAVGTTTPSSPTLKVTSDDGRPVRGVVVNFAVAGGGRIAAAVDTTDGNGLATSGAWTLGTTMGPQTVTATSPSLAGTSATFTANATAGPPSKLVFVTQPPLSVGAGEQFTGPVVEIQDTFGNRTSSTLAVTLNLAGSGGPASLTGITTVNAVDGRATFGPLSTPNTGQLSLIATTTDQNVGAAISNAMTVASGSVAKIIKLSGDVQQGDAGTSVFLPPIAKVTDAFDNPIAGAVVTFSVIAGGGSVSNTTASSDANGIAKVTKWTLGPGAGTNVVRATSGTGQADFTATALPATPYHIELRYLNLPTRRQQEAFERAWLKWRSVITADIPDWNYVPTPSNNTLCGRPAAAEVFEDLVIYVNLGTIDGEGKVLGSAGPCAANPANLLPFVGNMTFDTADLDWLDRQGQLDQVVVHEMGHVFGIGTLWSFKGLLIGGGTDSSSFNGPAAKAAWQALGGPAGSRVPVENCVGYTSTQCGPGQQDGHWRESTFRAELMTPFLDENVAVPLSALSIASLQDLGYSVNMAMAEAYTRTGALVAGGAGSGTGGTSSGGASLRKLAEVKPSWDILVDNGGGQYIPIEEWVRLRNARLNPANR